MSTTTKVTLLSGSPSVIVFVLFAAALGYFLSNSEIDSAIFTALLYLLSMQVSYATRILTATFLIITGAARAKPKI